MYTVEQHEEKIFKAASRFRVTRYVDNNTAEAMVTHDYAEALRVVWPMWKRSERAVIHALTDAGDCVLLPKSRTVFFAKLWLARLNV